MKKYITLLLLASALTACGTRQSPNELIVVKYKELVIPKNTLTLPEPDESRHNLGYKSAQDTIAQSINLKTGGKTDKDILKLWDIKKVNPSIKNEINNLKQSKNVVDIEKEKERITNNKKNNVSITKGKTPGKDLNI